MAIISPLAEHLILAGELRKFVRSGDALSTLVAALAALGQQGYVLMELDISVAGGSERVLYQREVHTIRVIGHKGEVFDLTGKGAARIAHRTAWHLCPFQGLARVKPEGKPRPLPTPPLPTHPCVGVMLSAGQAWLSERQARALGGQTTPAAPAAPAPRGRL